MGMYMYNAFFILFVIVAKAELREELVDTRITLRVLLQNLGDGHFKVLLPDILPSFTQSVHACFSQRYTSKNCDVLCARRPTCFGADTPDLGTRTVAHLLGQ